MPPKPSRPGWWSEVINGMCVDCYKVGRAMLFVLLTAKEAVIAEEMHVSCAKAFEEFTRYTG